MALFTSGRDYSMMRHVNREILNDVISQQASFYKYKIGATKVNIYGEASGEKYFEGPYIFSCLITRSDQDFPDSELGVNFNQAIDFAFLRDDLVDTMYVPEVGDIVLYQEGYYEIDDLIANQYFGGKNPDYPNNGSAGQENPLNPGLQNFGANLSIVAKTHYVPADKLNISPYKERM
tara:strand:- start:5042 stop:5572 length:531 start_codon:yes stop_codon:yes gene_type:complete